MHASLPLTAFTLIGLSSALPRTGPLSPFAPIPMQARQSNTKLCSVIGSTTLPAEVSDAASALANSITCSTSKTTISGVPDVTSGNVTYSSIDFSTASTSPLKFALDTFATASTLADTDLKTFQDMRDVYVATEAGIRSVGGSLAIKAPKFFLQMQVSRIQTAQGNPPAEAGLQVDHLRDKVTKNAGTADKAFVDQVTQLAAQTS
ncbi:hypothetical protein F5B20DRAFT_276426 [Whalleya microplaca]|nr:hypothetical protein F5B20DRAFT_276426 [Whalleya microplaca]